MMAAAKETAEQKLLKMIETSSSGEAEKASKTEKKVVKKQNILSLVKTVNKVMLVALIIAIAFLVLEVNSGLALMRTDIRFDAQSIGTVQGAASEDSMPQDRSVSYYLAGVDRRNIFQPYEAEIRAVAMNKENRAIVQKTGHLKLVGISWLETVESASVMLEDTAKKVTYFLQKGEKLDDIHVKTIYADSVELGYEDEEIIIRYDKSQM